MTKEEFIEKAKDLNYSDWKIREFLKIAKNVGDEFDFGIIPLSYQAPKEGGYNDKA